DVSYRILLLSLPRPLRPSLFPYTKLFRSYNIGDVIPDFVFPGGYWSPTAVSGDSNTNENWKSLITMHDARATGAKAALIVLSDRSEEHTSELQSRRELVCRLLLEKKKTRN